MPWLRTLLAHRCWLALTGLTLLVACGPSKKAESPGDSSTSATAADLDATCESECSLSDRCVEPGVTNAPHAECVSSCMVQLGDASVFRQDVLSALTGCFDSLACDVSDDTCTGEAVAVVTAAPTEDPRFQDCRSRHDVCSSGGAGFSDDDCVLRFFLVPSAQAQFDVCLHQDCATIADCIDTLRGA